MNQTTLHHLRALEAHHQNALNSVRDLIRMEIGEEPAEKHEFILLPPGPALPAPCTLLNRSETHRIRKPQDTVMEALSILEQDTFSTGDVLRVIKAAFPREYAASHHTMFRKELAVIARSGIIRLELQGSGRRGARYSK